MKKPNFKMNGISKSLLVAIMFLIFAVVANIFVGMFKIENKKERYELFQNDMCSTGMCQT